MNTYIQIHTHIHVHTHTYARTHTHTHPHITVDPRRLQCSFTYQYKERFTIRTATLSVCPVEELQFRSNAQWQQASPTMYCQSNKCWPHRAVSSPQLMPGAVYVSCGCTERLRCHADHGNSIRRQRCVNGCRKNTFIFTLRFI
jgi:hypothetical protein